MMKLRSFLLSFLFAATAFADAPFVFPGHIPPDQRDAFYDEWKTVSDCITRQAPFYYDGAATFAGDATKIDPEYLATMHKRDLKFLPEILVYLKISLNEQMVFNDGLLRQGFKPLTEKEKAILTHLRTLDQDGFKTFSNALALTLFRVTEGQENKDYPTLSKMGLSDFYELAHNPELPRLRLAVVNLMIQENLGYGFRVRVEELIEKQRPRLRNPGPGAENQLAKETIDAIWSELILAPQEDQPTPDTQAAPPPPQAGTPKKAEPPKNKTPATKLEQNPGSANEGSSFERRSMVEI